MMWSKGLILLCALLFLSGPTSCNPEIKKSVLILAFDDLGSELIDCDSDFENQFSGFQILCNESVQFTKAYTTSLQPAAAIASILTGQLPLVHEVHHSFNKLNPKIKTVTEIYSKMGYRTGFFAGNAHVLKKTKLSYFFDLFDDSIAANSGRNLIKDFSLSAQTFLDWQNEDKSKAFFSIITNSEVEPLNYSETKDTSLNKLDEKLYTFFTELKQRNLWENTDIILIGLKGTNKFNRTHETSYQNLHTENSAITFFLKRPKSSEKMKINSLVSLADLGFTLFQNLKFTDFEKVDLLPYQKNITNEFPIKNLNDVIAASQSNLTSMERENYLLIEAPLSLLNAQKTTEQMFFQFSLVGENSIIIAKKRLNEAYNIISDPEEKFNRFNNNDKAIKKIKTKLIQFKKILSQKVHNISLFDEKPFSKEFINFHINKKFLKLLQFDFSLLDQFFKSEKIELNNPLFLIQSIILQKDFNLELKKDLNQNYTDCLNLISETKMSEEKMEKCKDSLFIDYLKFKFTLDLGLDQSKTKLNYELSKKRLFEENQVAIWNMALENIWGLYDQNKIWYHPLIFIDPQFLPFKN